MFNKTKNEHRVRKTVKKFLFLPIVYRGKFHWLSSVKLEKGFNGDRMVIIDLEKL